MDLRLIFPLYLSLSFSPCSGVSITEAIPLVSQLKYVVQYASGDTEGASETHKNFLDTCPVISQVKSFKYWWDGDSEAAKKTQGKFVEVVSSFVDGIPGVGHVKGVIHYACGDKEGGDTAMKSASRTVGVLEGGVVGGLTLGPAGAIAGGTAGGAVMDVITTAVDSAVHNKYRPAGQVAAVGNIINGDATVGDIFDSVLGLVCDGFAGYNAGQAAIKSQSAENNVRRVAGEAEIENSVKAGKLTKPIGNKGEVWMSEGMEHTKAYYDSRTFADKGIMEIEIPRDALREIKADMIKQEGSKVVQKARLDAGQGRANLFNTERLQNNPQGKVNIGIKGKANLQAFNEHVIKIRKIPPDSLNPGVGTNTAGTMCHIKDLGDAIVSLIIPKLPSFLLQI